MTFHHLSFLFLVAFISGFSATATDDFKERNNHEAPEEFPILRKDATKRTEHYERKLRALLGDVEGVTLDVPTDKRPDITTVVDSKGKLRGQKPPGQHSGSTRIIDGSQAHPQRYPYYCFMAIYDLFGDFMGNCGCSLVHTDMVLSAAHCYYDKQFEIGSVGIFVNTTSNPLFSPATGYEQGAWMENAWWPSGYVGVEGGSIDYDFLIMKLDRAITGITPVTMNSNSAIPDSGDGVTVFGFGRTSSDGGMPDFLEYVDVTVKSSSTCSSNYPSLYEDAFMVCAGDYGQGSCKGDSGGPLIVPGSSASSDVLVGLVSFGSADGCSDVVKNSPSVYSRVSWWRDDIVSVICTESDFSSNLCGGSGGSGGACATSPTGWTDSYGDGCDWYEEHGCTFGSIFENQGKTANQACCTCGGGSGGGSQEIQLTWKGWSGCSTSSPCGKCEGDCDSDSHCAGSLKCYSRNGKQAIPGCSGSGISGGDYCY